MPNQTPNRTQLETSIRNTIQETLGSDNQLDLVFGVVSTDDSTNLKITLIGLTLDESGEIIPQQDTPMNPYTTAAPGCYVDGWWGIYAPARATLIARELGAPVTSNAFAIAAQELASSPDHTNPEPTITLDQCDEMIEALEQAEAWLNQNRSAPDHYWGWHEGDWGHWPIDDPDNHH